MPSMAKKTASSAATRRFWKQKATNRSIIEKDPALHDHALAGLEVVLDDGRVALLVIGLDLAALEGPRLHLDEDAGAVVRHQQRRCRDHEPQHRRCAETGMGNIAW